MARRRTIRCRRWWASRCTRRLRAGRELADWYRRRGCRVIMGGLHVLSCPDELRPHADALAIGDGVQLGGDPPGRGSRHNT